MSDDALITEIAKLWVSAGGDADGFDFCYQKIKEAIKNEIELKENHE